MAAVESRTEDWRTLPWKDIQRTVFRLQKRIYRAARQGDIKRCCPRLTVSTTMARAPKSHVRGNRALSRVVLY